MLALRVSSKKLFNKDKERYKMVRKRRIFVIATFLIIAAIAVVLCVGFFADEKKKEIDGTLVRIQIEQNC